MTPPFVTHCPRWSASLTLLLGLVGCGKKAPPTPILPQAYDNSSNVLAMPTDLARQLAEKLATDDRIKSLCAQARPVAETCKAYDQKRSQWCAGFSNLFLLEDSQRKRLPQSPPLSILHFASLGTANGGLPLLGVVDYNKALEHLQRHGELLPETDFPFDAGLFDRKLKQTIDAAFLDSYHIGLLDTPTYNLYVADGPVTAARAKAKNLRDFEKYLEIPLTDLTLKHRTNAPHATPIAAFDIDSNYFENDFLNEGFESLLTDLAQRPMNVHVCAALADTKSNYEGQCGLHDVAIVTARLNNDRCQLLILNSWGNEWGTNGSLWLDVDKFVSWLPYKSRKATAELFTLGLRAATDDAPIANRISSPSAAFRYQGETGNGQPSGHGELNMRDFVVTGTFEHGQVVSGSSVIHFPGTKLVSEEFNGRFKNDKYDNGDFKRYDVDGKLMAEFHGQWTDGKIWNGTLSYFSTEKQRIRHGTLVDGIFKDD